MQKLRLLLIEDCEDDIALVQEALSGPDLPTPIALAVAHDAAEATIILNSQPIDLILLDHALPDLPGIHWLQQFKASHPHRRIPVIMLTGLQDDQHIRAAYQQYASAYLVKPLHPETMRDMLGTFLQYWGQVARLPPSEVVGN